MAGYTDSVGCDVGWYWLASDCWSWNAGWHWIHHVVVHRQSGLWRWHRARDSEGGYSRGFSNVRDRGRSYSNKRRSTSRRAVVLNSVRPWDQSLISGSERFRHGCHQGWMPNENKSSTRDRKHSYVHGSSNLVVHH